MIDITEWNKKPWYHTKGTREKWIVENENDFEFYFKTSIKKEGKHYPFEFLSEVIASRLGRDLGLPVLNYGVATSENTIGCLCPSMLLSNNHLIEGVQYLQAYDANFNPEMDKKGASKQYSFQFIEQALKVHGLSLYMRDIIKIVIFDSIIGNQDRHQENWGTIISYQPKIDRDFFEKPVDSYGSLLKLSGRNMSGNNPATREYRAYQDINTSLSKLSFAPIYDNGSSLGRELSEDKISKMLKDSMQYNAYVRNGKSEIKWHGRELSHIELVKNILNGGGYADTESEISQIVERYNEDHFRTQLESICNDIPSTFAEFSLSKNRKDLIVKLTTTRIKLLKSLL